MDEIIIIIGLIVLNGIFAMSEVALISARKSRLSTDVKKGNKSARVALKLAGDPDRFLSTVQIGITLIGILTGIYSGNKIAVDLTNLLISWGVASSYAFGLAQGIIVVIVTYLTIIFGELVPKRIGMSMAERMAKLVARPMNVLAKVALPFVWLLSKSTEAIFNLLGIKDTDSKVTEEEIKSIIKEGADDGEVQPVEQDIVQRVFLLGDLKVGSIMTHKSDIVALESGMTAAEVKAVLVNELYEFYPVTEDGDLDKVKGVVNLKDLVLHLSEENFNLPALTHEATFLHENMTIIKDAVRRKKFSESQTHKNRQERQENVSQVFEAAAIYHDGQGEHPITQLEGKHILIIDDVCTTGATIISCAETLIKAAGKMKISVLTVGFAHD